MGYVKDKHHSVGWEGGQGYVFFPKLKTVLLTYVIV
jgi:hypothetical protein